MVNPPVHWLQVTLFTRSRITLRELSRSWGIVFWIPLRRLSGFQVPLGLVFPAHPLLLPGWRSFEFSISFFVALTNLGLIALWCHIGWYFVASFARFSPPSSQNVEMVLLYSVSDPIKFHAYYSISLVLFYSIEYVFCRCIIHGRRCWWLLVDRFW